MKFKLFELLLATALIAGLVAIARIDLFSFRWLLAGYLTAVLSFSGVAVGASLGSLRWRLWGLLGSLIGCLLMATVTRLLVFRLYPYKYFTSISESAVENWASEMFWVLPAMLLVGTVLGPLAYLWLSAHSSKRYQFPEGFQQPFGWSLGILGAFLTVSFLSFLDRAGWYGGGGRDWTLIQTALILIWIGHGWYWVGCFLKSESTQLPDNAPLSRPVTGLHSETS